MIKHKEKWWKPKLTHLGKCFILFQSSWRPSWHCFMSHRNACICSRGNFSWKNNSEAKNSPCINVYSIIYIRLKNINNENHKLWTTEKWGKYIQIHLHVVPSGYFPLKWCSSQLKSQGTYNFVYFAVLITVAESGKQLNCPVVRKLRLFYRPCVTLLKCYAAMPSNYWSSCGTRNNENRKPDSEKRARAMLTWSFQLC